MKTEIRWRVSAKKRAALEKESRRRRVSLSRLLEEITRDWLARQPRVYTAAEEAAVRRRAMKAIGAVRGGDPTGSERTSEKVREIIFAKFEEEKRRSLEGRNSSRS
jgi:hypothetical protein